MKTPDDVTAMVRLNGSGLGRKADCCRAWMFEEHGEALASLRGLASMRDAVAIEASRRPG